MPDLPALEVENLSIRYRSNGQAISALHGVHLSVHSGEFVSLIGPSGCGKTTLLNAIAGILPNDCWQEGTYTHNWSQRDASLGYLFQKDTLLPWCSVQRNVEVPLAIQGVSRREQREQSLRLLSQFGLEGFEESYPHQLSGGMRQRTLLARTLIYDPELILLDEPLGSLDAQTRVVLQDELLTLWQETGKTFILVTHDLEEAITLSERVILMGARPGCIRGEYRVELERGQSAFEVRLSREFSQTYRRIWEDLSRETRSQLAGGAADQAPVNVS